MATVRETNFAGPCVTLGELVRETASFYVYREHACWVRPGEQPKEKRAKKGGWRHHVEPCPCCCDHAKSQYPNGYDN